MEKRDEVKRENRHVFAFWKPCELPCERSGLSAQTHAQETQQRHALASAHPPTLSLAGSLSPAAPTPPPHRHVDDHH